MNQIAAALLILSASVCGYTSAVRPADGVGGLSGLVAMGLGLWGVMALLASVLREREMPLDVPAPRLPALGATALSGLRSLATPRSGYEELGRDYNLPHELNAQVLAAAEMRGQNRRQVVEETLRRHLPRTASSSRVA